MTHIRLERIGREFPGTPPLRALDEVSLEVLQGEWVSVVGPSGGGKSTLLNIVALLDAPTAGTYLLDGVDVAGVSERTRSRLRSERFGFVFQSFHLLDRRPVIDSVELGLLYRGLPAAERAERARAALDAVGLADFADRQAKVLSGGQRQRVAVARALASASPIVVADEPTGNLDSASGEQVLNALDALHRAGSTIILVTHSPEVAARAPRSIRIADGRVSNPDSVATAAPAAEQPDEDVRVPSAAAPGRPATLRLRDLFSDAFASLGSRMRRTVALVSAVAIGIGLTVATVGFSQSAQSQVSQNFDAHLNRYVTVSWPSGVDLTAAAADTEIASRVAGIDGVERAGMLVDHGAHVIRVSPTRPAFSAPMLTATAGVPQAAELTVRWAPGIRHRIQPGQALVGRSLADQLQLGTVDSSPTILIDGRAVAVVGVIAESPRVPALSGQVLLSPGDGEYLGEPSGAKLLALVRPGAAQVVARAAPLAADPFEPGRLDVEAPPDPQQLRTEVEGSVRLALGIVSAVSLAAAVVSLGNAMSSAIAERRPEIGLRRALGAMPRHIAGLVVVESAIIGLIGGIGGLVLSIAGILGVTIANRWVPVLDVRLIPLALIGGVLIGGIGCVAAAVRAIRVQPSDALRG
ncbi:ATP-binding cassette domain-containing protein [Gryllotalpicola reticulitermitis]|uniref:ATP-binding cassette domain-containing protein n=1 Tax=Gryllotalpicola reticulitermitis TaxID=1184153 RepID=A0ABV8Q8P8_9MICO